MKIALSILSLAAIVSLNAQAVEVCGAEKSAGNPYPCKNGGNCTWWTWKKAKEAGWIDIPSGSNANAWDDFAKAKPKLYVMSTTAVAGAVGVKNSSPYCDAWDAKGKCTHFANTGHVGYVKSVSGSTVDTSEMDYGVNGVKQRSHTSSYFDWYIVNTDGKTAAEIACTDGKALKTTKDAAGNSLVLYSSSACQTKWTVAVAKNPADLVVAGITRSADARAFSVAGRGNATSPMVQTGSAKACADAKFKAVVATRTCG